VHLVSGANMRWALGALVLLLLVVMWMRTKMRFEEHQSDRADGASSTSDERFEETTRARSSGPGTSSPEALAFCVDEEGVLTSRSASDACAPGLTALASEPVEDVGVWELVQGTASMWWWQCTTADELRRALPRVRERAVTDQQRADADAMIESADRPFARLCATVFPDEE
jgi:hypothetical protein